MSPGSNPTSPVAPKSLVCPTPHLPLAPQRLVSRSSVLGPTLFLLSNNDLPEGEGDSHAKLVEGVLQVLKPFKEVTMQVSAEKYVTSSATYPPPQKL